MVKQMDPLSEKKYFFFPYEYDIHNKKMKKIKKTNYIQRNLDDKRSARH